MSENIHLYDRSLDVEIPQWMGVQGVEVISNERVRFESRISRLPEGQLWTPQNVHLSNELNTIAEKYKKEGKINGPVLTLQSCVFRGVDVDLNKPLNTNFSESMVRRGWRSKSVIVDFLQAGYFEAAAYVNGEVPGMENPQAAVVSVETVTRDGKYVFAIRADSSGTGPGMYGVPGGVLDQNPKAGAIAELEEELGITMYPEDESEDLYVHFDSLCFDQKNRPIIIYRARLPYNKSEVEEMWSASPDVKSEHKELVFLDGDRDSLLKFAKQHPPSMFHSPANIIFTKILKGSFLTEEEDNLMGGLSG